jgi:hypothetical protein
MIRVRGYYRPLVERVTPREPTLAGLIVRAVFGLLFVYFLAYEIFQRAL